MRLANTIRSEFDDDELLFREEKNKIYYMFELVGIYEAYLQEDEREEFNKYYAKKHNTSEYHFRNVGVQAIFKQMVLQEGGYLKYEKSNMYKMSKRKMRLYGITHKHCRVCVCLGWDKVTFVLNEYIKSNKEVEEIYRHCIKEVGDEATKYLTFHSECIDARCNLVTPTKRHREYIKMREDIKKHIQELNM